MNRLWAWMIIVGIVFGAFNGRMPQMTNAALDAAKEAITLCITMTGVMSFWVGMMEIATQAGIVETASRKMQPVLRFLFPLVKGNNTLLIFTNTAGRTDSPSIELAGTNTSDLSMPIIGRTVN